MDLHINRLVDLQFNLQPRGSTTTPVPFPVDTTKPVPSIRTDPVAHQFDTPGQKERHWARAGWGVVTGPRGGRFVCLAPMVGGIQREKHRLFFTKGGSLFFPGESSESALVEHVVFALLLWFI